MYGQIIQGCIGGFAYSLSGLAGKEIRKDFDWKRMAPTIVVAGVVGGIAGFSGQDYGILANSSMAAGITVVAQKVFKAIYKKYSKAKK